MREVSDINEPCCRGRHTWRVSLYTLDPGTYFVVWLQVFMMICLRCIGLEMTADTPGIW